MAIREITLKREKGAFSIFKKNSSQKNYDFSGILDLRQLLSNEKARILHIIKTQKPNSIYELAKILNRGFKAVNDDIRLLEKYGFVELAHERIGSRTRYRPVLITDLVTINFKI